MGLRNSMFGVIVFLVCVASQAGSASPQPQAVNCIKPEHNMKRCITQNGVEGVCSYGLCFIPIRHTARQVLLKVKYNKTNSYLPAQYKQPTMWIRGNAMGLTWSEGRKLKETTQEDTWEILLTLNISSTTEGEQGVAASRLEFRLYLNNEQDMLGGNFRIPFPLSMSVYDMSDLRGVPSTWVYPWFFSKSGAITRRVIYSPQLEQRRNITIYTPPSFHENQYKRYETLFFNDGQRVEFLLPQLDVLIVRTGYIREIVVIAIVNNATERVKLLAPTNGSEIFCKKGSFKDGCGGCLYCYNATKRCNYWQLVKDYRCYKWTPFSTKGQRYLDFMEDTLQREAQNVYRTLPGAENVGIMGFSFGGLVACHGLWTRPHFIGSAACMSPSLWWPFPSNDGAVFPNDTEYEFVKVTLTKYRGPRPKQKVYIDVGSEEGPVMIDPARNATRVLGASPYFELNKNLWFYIWPDEHHNFTHSLKRIWVALLAMYGTEGASTSGAGITRGTPTSGATRHATLGACSLLAVSIIILFLRTH